MWTFFLVAGLALAALMGCRMAGNAVLSDDLRRKQYQEHRNRAAQRQADIAEAGQEIPAPPAPLNPQRRESCVLDFKLFCETYFPRIFYLNWSPDHLGVIVKIERAVLKGELFALAMPRGSGKSSLCRTAIVWAILNGHHPYACLIAATASKARKELAKISHALERNELLAQDFPEVVDPIRALERSPQRARKQRCEGEYTNMEWTKDIIVMPTIKDSVASGGVISACGLTGGEIRGQSYDRPDGSIVRPTLVLPDDPQTRKSARSLTQCQERVELLQGDVLGMAGPDRAIAGIMPCTVIEAGDMADNILDAEENPDWGGERLKMVYEWPENEMLWEEYFRLRDIGLRRRDTSEADEFYRKNRAAMDLGSRVAWDDGYPKDKAISTIQYAMNLRHRSEVTFFAEYQNEPLSNKNDNDDLLTAEQIAAKLNRREQRRIPSSCNHVVMYIDVHKKLLYWTVMAFEDNFTGYVLDYGVYPDQKKQYFAMRTSRRTLSTAHRGKGEEAAIYAGLEAITAEQMGKPWIRDDNANMHVGLCLIDSGYQKDTVELFIRQSKFAGRMLPSKGLPISASSLPLDERKGKKGEKIGDNWRLSAAQGQYSVRLCLIDSNYWKSFLHARLAVDMGGAGCLSLYGKTEYQHRLYSEHLTAEYRVKTEGRGREVDEWKEYTHKPDNHWLDTSAGCCVAASILGCKLLGVNLKRTARRKRGKKKATYLSR